ncbi:hypothetical protein BJI67_15830 (plasmid) [Acidihalobacter aeolianus]|uniref:YqaJ viral recombinase domain-containing protein n=1 Tax=Acidihalobacter aeolianus TaxID=2792603 RepID=A0A1D8KCP5_9GAMM|nr:YqaJ viral recombinase family protein [Acidihalobacter aeolianus]AOV18713.1 hypothetical protein BJI67_15830 [Acidihalobacter aeolianus]
MFVPLVQGTPEWLLWREDRFQSSEAPMIMGLSPFKTAYRLWQEKTKQVPPLPPHPGMIRGLQEEPIAREHREFQTLIETPPACLECELEGLRLGASLDGYAARPNARHLLREIKAPANPDHEAALAGFIPKKYRDQMEHQALVICTAFSCDIRDLEAEYVSWRPGHPKGEMAVVPFEPNPDRWKQLIKAYHVFQQHLDDGTEPLGDAFLAAAWVWRQANEAHDDAKFAVEQARQLIIEAMPDGVDRNEGGGVLVTRSTRVGSLNNEAIFKALQSEFSIPDERLAELKAAHRGKDTETWRITPKGDPTSPPAVLPTPATEEAAPSGWAW